MDVFSGGAVAGINIVSDGLCSVRFLSVSNRMYRKQFCLSLLCDYYGCEVIL